MGGLVGWIQLLDEPNGYDEFEMTVRLRIDDKGYD
jgi:hypothetical protein